MLFSLPWGLRLSAASFLGVIFTQIRGNLPMNKLARLQWDTEEWLFLVSHQYMGWPHVRNRWLYPDVFGWDEDDHGNNYLPGLIAFYWNIKIDMNSERKEAFLWQLSRSLPGPWELTWHSPGLVWANRKPYTYYFQESERVRGSRRLAPYEVPSKPIDGYISNGRPEDASSSL